MRLSASKRAVAGLAILCFHWFVSPEYTHAAFEFRYLELHVQYFSEISESDLDDAADLSSLIEPDEKELLQLLKRRQKTSCFNKNDVRIRVRTSDGVQILFDHLLRFQIGKSTFELNDQGVELRTFISRHVPSLLRFLGYDAHTLASVPIRGLLTGVVKEVHLTSPTFFDDELRTINITSVARPSFTRLLDILAADRELSGYRKGSRERLLEVKLENGHTILINRDFTVLRGKDIRILSDTAQRALINMLCHRMPFARRPN